MQAIDVAEALGYDFIRLDTFGRMDKALELYKYLGFEEIQPYYDNPQPDAIFLQKRL